MWNLISIFLIAFGSNAWIGDNGPSAPLLLIICILDLRVLTGWALFQRELFCFLLTLHLPFPSSSQPNLHGTVKVWVRSHSTQAKMPWREASWKSPREKWRHSRKKETMIPFSLNRVRSCAGKSLASQKGLKGLRRAGDEEEGPLSPILGPWEGHTQVNFNSHVINVQGQCQLLCTTDWTSICVVLYPTPFIQ